MITLANISTMSAIIIIVVIRTLILRNNNDSLSFLYFRLKSNKTKVNVLKERYLNRVNRFSIAFTISLTMSFIIKGNQVIIVNYLLLMSYFIVIIILNTKTVNTFLELEPRFRNEKITLGGFFAKKSYFK